MSRPRLTPVAVALALSAVLGGDLAAVAVQRSDDEPVRAVAAPAAPSTLAPIPPPAITTAAPAPVSSAPATPQAPRTTAPTAAPTTARPTTAPPSPARPLSASATAAYGPVAMPSCPSLPPGISGPKTVTPTVPDSRVPAPVAAPPAGRADLSALRGRSVWVTPFRASALDVADIVTRSRRAGLTAIWVRTGGSRQGYYGDALLRRLVPVAHAAGLKVIAWDFPFLSDPMADVQRARRALAFRVDGQGIDAFSPDIETTAEGVFASPRRIASYLSRVRALAGTRAVVTTVPRPTDRNLRRYPYAMQARWVDAYAPMVYWSCREPGTVAIQAVQRLKQYRPVHVVGQGYDMGPEGGRRGLPTARETLRFFDASRRAGAIGGSLWTAERFGPGQWGPLATYPWPATR